MKLDQAAKSATAGLTAALGSYAALAAAPHPQGITVGMWVSVIVAGLAGAGLTYHVPNAVAWDQVFEQLPASQLSRVQDILSRVQAAAAASPAARGRPATVTQQLPTTPAP